MLSLSPRLTGNDRRCLAYPVSHGLHAFLMCHLLQELVCMVLAHSEFFSCTCGICLSHFCFLLLIICNLPWLWHLSPTGLLLCEVSESLSVMSDSLQPHGLEPAQLLCPWDSPGKNTGVGYHSLLQRIFLTQGPNPGLQHHKCTLYHLSHQGLLLYWKPNSEQMISIAESLVTSAEELVLQSYRMGMESLTGEPSVLRALCYSWEVRRGGQACLGRPTFKANH